MTSADAPNPHVLAAHGTRPDFVQVFGGLSPAELRRVFSDYNLGSPLDISDKTSAELVDLLFERAQRKVAERRSALY